MSGLALGRLTEERKLWRKDHPYGFIAKPKTNSDGTLNLKDWDCIVPGRKGTPWEGGLYKFSMNFLDTYPITPPIIRFNPPIFHPNVYPSGMVCLSLLNQEADWCPGISVKQILLGIQSFLDEPNVSSPANAKAANMFSKDPDGYKQAIIAQAKKFSS